MSICKEQQQQEFIPPDEYFEMIHEVGLILDLDEGVLSLHKNGNRIEFVSGLVGEYICAASVLCDTHGPSIRIGEWDRIFFDE